MSTIETDMRGKLEDEGRHYTEQRELEGREAAGIEQEIDATRADMRATLEALERRFSFDRLVELTVGRIRDRGGEFAGNLTDAATQNPLPLLLTSIGVGWMMLASRRGTRSNDGTSPSSALRARRRMGSVRERASEVADRAYGAAESTRDTLKDAADSTREKVRGAADSTREAFRNATHASRESFEQTTASLHETADSLRDTAGRAVSATREQVGHARERMDRLLHEEPLMLGALGLAAGAIIGALLPATEQEGRLFGELRDKAVNEVTQKTRARSETSRPDAATYAAASGTDDDAPRGPHSRPH